MFLFTLAEMAELVDALDLGSSSRREWGFKSPSSHQQQKELALRGGFFFWPRAGIYDTDCAPFHNIPQRALHVIWMEAQGRPFAFLGV